MTKRLIVKDMHLFGLGDLIGLLDYLHGPSVNSIYRRTNLQCGKYAYNQILYLISEPLIEQLKGAGCRIEIKKVTDDLKTDTVLALSEIKFAEIFIPKIGHIGLYHDYAYDNAYDRAPSSRNIAGNQYSTLTLASTQNYEG